MKEADMVAAKIDLLLKKFDERATNTNIGTINALDSQMTCEVYGNVGHSGNDCSETHEDATYINNGFRQQGGGNNNGWSGNLVCLHVVQNGIQATSTPRTTFHQEGEDDEVMIMLGELHGGQSDQQGHPNREGGPKLIRFESPRWRPKSSLSSPQNRGPVYLELVIQDAYGLRFR
jgi:hypothetical protein